MTPTEQDILVVLTKLGTPSELEDKYNQDSIKCLIGGSYYTKYKSLLKTVLPCVVFGLTIAVPIIAVTLQTVWYMALLKWFSITFQGLFYAFGSLTLIFAIFYHKGLELSNKNNKLNNLPPVPKPQFIIPKCQPIGGIAMCVVFFTIFLGTPEVIIGIFGEHPAAIPVLNIEVVKKSWLFIITFALMGVIRECTKLIDGKYTIRLMIVTVVTDFFSVILALV